MKIGILTLPLHTNYGGILQAYALQTTLERMGHEVKVIDRNRKPEVNISINVRLKRLILKYIFKKEISRITILEEYKITKRKNKYVWAFSDKYIKRREIKYLTEINKDEFEAIIVGSDQIWRREYFLNSYTNAIDAFLAFTKKWNIKRIAYAPSFGIDAWEYSLKETADIKKLLSNFDLITVREEKGVELCKKFLNISATLVLDPTLLLNKNDYISLFAKKRLPVHEGNLFCYILDNTKKKQRFIQRVEKKMGLQAFALCDKREEPQPSVEEWLKCFYQADYVITDSFHGCVFSIIFKKPFVVFENPQRGNSRFRSLLKKCGLEDRIIKNYKTFNIDSINGDNFMVQDIVETLKKQSIELLDKTLQLNA